MFTKIKSYLKDQWFEVTDIFYINFTISLASIEIGFKIFDKGFELSFYLHWLPFKWWNIWDKSYEVKNNKCWEQQFAYGLNLTTGFNVNWSMHCDHAGFESEWNLLGIEYYLNHIDCRHWDYNKNTFEVYD